MNDIIPALTQWQPWATLVAIGAKQYETRSWSTEYRGPLLIHVAKKRDKESLKLCRRRPFYTALNEAGYFKDDDLPFGAFLAVVDLTNVYPTEKIFVPHLELPFGDFSPGRFAWELDNLRKLPEPIPAPGNRKLWNVRREDYEQIWQFIEAQKG